MGFNIGTVAIRTTFSIVSLVLSRWILPLPLKSIVKLLVLETTKNIYRQVLKFNFEKGIRKHISNFMGDPAIAPRATMSIQSFSSAVHLSSPLRKLSIRKESNQEENLNNLNIAAKRVSVKTNAV